MLEYQRKNDAEIENKKNLFELRRFRKRKVESLKEVSPIKLSCFREITDTVKIKVTDDAQNSIEENRVRIPIPLACHLYLEVKKLSNSVHLRRKISEIPRPTHFGYSGNSSQILNISSSLNDVMPEESIYLSDVRSTVSTKNEFAVKHPLSLEKYVKKYKVTINKNEIFGKVNGSHNRIKEVFHNSPPFDENYSSSSCIKSFDVPTIIEATTDEPGPSMLQVHTTSNIFSPKQILNSLPNYCQTVESSSETLLVPCINADRKMFAIKAPRNDSYLNEPPLNSNSVTMKEIYDIYSKVSSDFLSILTNQFHSNVILPNIINYLPIQSQILHQDNENFDDYVYEHQNYSYNKKNSFPSKSTENNLNVKTELKPVNTLKIDGNIRADLSLELNVSSNISESSSILSSIIEPIEDNKVNEVIDVMMQNCAKDTPHLNAKESLPSSQNGSTEESHSNSSTYKDPVEASSSEIIGSPYFSAKSPDTTNPGYHNPGELYFDSGNVEVKRSGTIKKSRKEEKETPGSDISPVDSTVEDEEEPPSTNGRKFTVIPETTPSEINKSSKNDTKLSSSTVNSKSSLEGCKTYEKLSSSSQNRQVNKIDFSNRINKRTRNLRRKNEIIKSNTKLNPFVKLKYFEIDRIDEVLREFCLKKVTFPLNVCKRLQIDESKYTHSVIKRKWISFYADTETTDILEKNYLTNELKQNESIREENQEKGVSTSVFSTNSAQEEFSHNNATSSACNPNLPLKSNEPLLGTTVKRKRGRSRKLSDEVQNKEAVNICNQISVESKKPQYTKITTSTSITSRNNKQDEEEVSSSGLDTDCFDDNNSECFSASNKFEQNYISSSDVSNLDSVTDQISSTVLTPSKITTYKDKLYKKTSEEPVSSSGIRAEYSEDENYSDKIIKKNKRRLDFKGILSNVESDENSLSSPNEGSSSSSSTQFDNSTTEDDNTEFNYHDFFSEKNKTKKHHGIREDNNDKRNISNKSFIIDDSHLDADDEFSCDPDFMGPLFDYSKINLQTLSEMFEKDAEEENDEEISDKEKSLDISNVQSCSFFNFNINDNNTQEDIEEGVVTRRKQNSTIKRKVSKRRTRGFYSENTRRKRNTKFSSVNRQMNFDQIETTQEKELDEINNESCAEDLAEAQFKGFRDETEVCTCTSDGNNSWSCGCCRNNLRKRGLIIKFIKQLLTPDNLSGTEKDKSNRKTFSNVNNSTTATYLSVHSSPCSNSVVQFPSSDCHEKDFDEESIIHKNISTTTVSDVLLSSSPCEIMLGISNTKSLHTTVKDSFDNKSLRPRKRHRNKVINSINETLVCNTNNNKDSFVHNIADTTRLGSTNDNTTIINSSTSEQSRESFNNNEGTTAFAQTAECSIPDASNTYFIYHGAQVIIYTFHFV
ncbi:hypothetical protein O3M35_012365 [Rhynocoris fuscipes]|uniref:Uncharacterized protein n=1 Tax=Rhynocoris fuscipes TaxID=488301 RepID=A0AAW1CVA6_9HEMI